MLALLFYLLNWDLSRTYKSLPLWVTKWHEGLRKQHSVLFFPECDRAAARQGGPHSGFPETSIAQFWGFAMVVDEEFFMFITTHPSARQYLILTILCTLLASTFSRKRRLQFEQFRTSGFVFKHPYKSKFESGRMISSPTIK